MQHINFIGLGHWGPNLVRAFINSQRARSASFAISPNRAWPRSIAISPPRSAPARIRSSPPPIRPADAVVIATPTNTHFALAQKALEAGKHVLVEKPLAGNVADAEALVELAENTAGCSPSDMFFCSTTAFGP